MKLQKRELHNLGKHVLNIAGHQPKYGPQQIKQYYTNISEVQFIQRLSQSLKYKRSPHTSEHTGKSII